MGLSVRELFATIGFYRARSSSGRLFLAAFGLQAAFLGCFLWTGGGRAVRPEQQEPSRGAGKAQEMGTHNS